MAAKKKSTKSETPALEPASPADASPAKKVAKKRAKKVPSKKRASRAKSVGKKSPGAPKGKRRSVEFKKAVVERILSGEKAVALSKELGISQPTLGAWKKRYAGDITVSKGSTSTAMTGREDGHSQKLEEGVTESAPRQKQFTSVAGLIQERLDRIEALKKEIQALAQRL